jgi:hypothetical protein
MKFVSVTIAARRLRCSDETIRRYIISGDLDGVQRIPRGWWMVSETSITNLSHKLHSPKAETPLTLAAYAR